MQGTLAPDLKGAGNRWSERQLRLRIVDAARLNPSTIMPPYYRTDGLGRVATSFRGKPVLTAEQVKLDIPPLVENGNTVPCTVTVESAMTAANHVKAIHIFAEKNPQPYVIGVALGPRAGRASVSTRIRLRDTQNVLAVAELSDGTFWSDRANVIVTIGACLEDVI